MTRSAPVTPRSAVSVDRTHAFVDSISRSLDFYRELGCEVRLVADGWVQLGSEGTALVLEQRATRVTAAPPLLPHVMLRSDDLHALRKRLLARGISTRSRATDRGCVREFEVLDPDGRRVIVAESSKPC